MNWRDQTYIANMRADLRNRYTAKDLGAAGAEFQRLFEYAELLLAALEEARFQSLARIHELVALGYELASLLEGVTQDERDRIETTAGILQSEWFRRQQSLLHRAHEVLWPDGLPNPHLREPFPRPAPTATK
jgi:hypothetical protein